MHKPTVLLILFVSFLSSCKKDAYIYYRYKDAEITRVNSHKTTKFYLGHQDHNTINNITANVMADWSFDDFLLGFVLFKDDGSVEIINGGGGSFHSVNENKKLYTRTYTSRQFHDLLKDYKSGGRYNNMMELSDNLAHEVQRNKAFNSEVQAVY